MTEYELVYDAARDFAGWQIVTGSIVMFLFLIVTIFFDEFIPRIVIWFVFWNDHITDSRRATFAVAVLLLGAASAGITIENLKLRSISKKNECAEISGAVTDFKSEVTDARQGRILGHRESFTLDDVKFRYDTTFMANGFNTSAADGGPIYEGAKVRLCYIERIENRKKERKIIRVETALKSS